VVLGGVERLSLGLGARNVGLFRACNLIVLALNINRLANKLDKLEFFIRYMNMQIDIMLLCETWSTTYFTQFFNIFGYNAFHHVRNTVGGGLSIFVRDNLQAELVGSKFLHSHINNDDHEFLIVELTKHKMKFGVTYRRPSSNIEGYVTKLDRILGKFKNIVLAGDTNINILDSSSQTTLLNNVLVFNGFKMINNTDYKYFTHKSHSGSINTIDHMFTDITLIETCLAVGDSDLSDHKILLLGFRIKDKTVDIKEKHTIKVNYSIIQDTLKI
jgi:hypothetical protein